MQMLFRGQNMLGYRHYADDAVEYFVQKSVANGIDILRIFDALNDPRNLQTAIKAAIKEKAHVQGCISYTLSPVHNNEYFAKYAKTLEEMGAHSICSFVLGISLRRMRRRSHGSSSRKRMQESKVAPPQHSTE